MIIPVPAELKQALSAHYADRNHSGCNRNWYEEEALQELIEAFGCPSSATWDDFHVEVDEDFEVSDLRFDWVEGYRSNYVIDFHGDYAVE